MCTVVRVQVCRCRRLHATLISGGCLAQEERKAEEAAAAAAKAAAEEEEAAAAAAAAAAAKAEADRIAAEQVVCKERVERG